VNRSNSGSLGKVVVSGVIVGPAIEQHWRQLYRQTELVILENESARTLSEALREADVLIIRPILDVPRATIMAARHLQGIVMWGVGYNNVDLVAATERGLPVVTVPVFLNSVAEAVFCFLMQMTKRYSQLNALVRAGKLPTLDDRGRALEGKTLGSIGLGRIGRRVARIAQAFEMKVLVYDPYLNQAEIDGQTLPLVSLPELLQQSDFVSLHAPLTDETRHLINADSLALMRAEAYLINVARGGLVDETALYTALVEKQIAGAALDTFENEPVSPHHPLLSLENVWATPHYLGATWEGLAQVAAATQDAALKLLRGEPPGYHVVNPEVLGETP
jgi:D-3-phosphoglycerate dehydrogenase